jgi:hypothetical protein
MEYYGTELTLFNSETASWYANPHSFAYKHAACRRRSKWLIVVSGYSHKTFISFVEPDRPRTPFENGACLS